MKNITILVSLLFCFQALAQRKPKIKGNRNVITVVESLPPFNAIELNDDLDIFLNQSSEEGYSLIIDDNLVDVLKFKVKDSTLVVTSFYKITAKKKLKITINCKSLNTLIVRDGKVKMTDVITTDKLDVRTYNSAKVEIHADVSQMDLLMEGNSAGDFNIQSDTLNIALKDRIDTRIYAVTDRINLTMTANSAVTMDGVTRAMSAKLFDNANLKARKLQAEGVELIAEGSPSAKVFASVDFELTSSGHSKTFLSGDAKIDIISFLDTSELHKEK